MRLSASLATIVHKSLVTNGLPKYIDGGHEESLSDKTTSLKARLSASKLTC